jgi:hypothetical protein
MRTEHWIKMIGGWLAAFLFGAALVLGVLRLKMPAPVAALPAVLAQPPVEATPPPQVSPLPPAAPVRELRPVRTRNGFARHHLATSRAQGVSPFAK